MTYLDLPELDPPGLVDDVGGVGLEGGEGLGGPDGREVGHPAGALGDDVARQRVDELALVRHHAQVLVHVPLQLLADVQLRLRLLRLQVVQVELNERAKIIIQ